VDSHGDLYVATGNSASTTTFDDGNAVVELSPAFALLGTFAPSDWADLNSTDSDLGSTAPTLVGGAVLQVGKSGVGYVLEPDHLRGVGRPEAQARVCAGGAYGGTAVVGAVAFVPCRGGVVAVRVGAASLNVVWRGPSGAAGPPVVTTGVVWSVDLDGGDLLALDQASGHLETRVHVGDVPHFAAPAVGDGLLAVPSGRGVVAFAG
jgi:hypothetical protein